MKGKHVSQHLPLFLWTVESVIYDSRRAADTRKIPRSQTTTIQC